MRIIFFSESQVTMTSVTIAMIAGYLVHAAEQQTSCENCLQLISSPANQGPAVSLIHFQDRGGLRYPNAFFRCLVQIVYDFVIEAVHYLPRKALLKSLVSFLKPRFSQELKCDTCKDEEMSLFLLGKLVKPLLDNIAKDISSKYEVIRKLNQKPLNRKVLKVQ